MSGSFVCNATRYTSQHPLVIAEIGTAHGGSVEKAFDLIHASADAGAECVKFQWVYASEILHPNTGTVPLPGGSIKLYDRFKELEVPMSFFLKVKDECEKCGCIFLCSPFGPKSATELIALQPSALKIASPELNYVQLLQQCAKPGIPLIMSTGVAQPEIIQEAIKITTAVPNRVLLNCVTSYPAPETDYNLAVLKSFATQYHVPAGVSDHSKDPLLVPLTSLANGACVIEKHITLSRRDGGLDDPVALEPSDFKKMTTELQKAATIIQNEGNDEALLPILSHRFGDTLIQRICGDGKKTLATSEAANYGRTNRSIHAAVAIAAGETFTAANTAVLRTEKELRPGLTPSHLDSILGKAAATDIPAGEGIRQIDVAPEKN